MGCRQPDPCLNRVFSVVRWRAKWHNRAYMADERSCQNGFSGSDLLQFFFLFGVSTLIGISSVLDLSSFRFSLSYVM
ncbi:hypothetical protein ASPFODRAFT_571649 [Aspergillus luchuensis CBS 106.47]|uniref:Uncharacterized protein n=1 Tax=Aspergillus luchuensis (strain CBS 106.47) TaxID=1137211 RepID=A0A1M3TKX4_ASPLC|nr:hypothetical protein ASPFODRAFT_571649 [Aspergillus luchuensis CBS 106.47]